MTFKTLSLLALTVSLLIACQKSDSPPPPVKPTDPPQDGREERLSSERDAYKKPIRNDGLIQKPLLLKISPRGGGPTSYLFGSYHWDISINELPYWALDLFDHAEVVAFEIDTYQSMVDFKKYLGHPEDETAFLKMFPQAKRNNLTDAQIAKLASIGIPKVAARFINPESCGGIEQMLIATGRPLQSLDGELAIRAHDLKKKILALEDDKIRKDAEDYARSVGYIEAKPCRAADYLKAPTQKAAQFEEGLLARKASYLSLSPKQFLNEKYQTIPEDIYRNHHWLGTLNNELRRKSMFITVGAAHLPGEHGLVQLLKAAGFDIEIVDESNAIIGT